MRVSGCCIALCVFLMKVRKGAAVLFLDRGGFAAAGREGVCPWEKRLFPARLFRCGSVCFSLRCFYDVRYVRENRKRL